MRRVVLVVAALTMFLVAGTAPVQAQGSLPPDPTGWAGGNGWCEAGVCFRAWPEPQGVEVRWVVDLDDAPSVAVLRLQLTPAVGTVPVRLKQSDGAGEFVYLDTEVMPGALYVYELVRAEDAAALGEALEAGLAAAAVDPGGSGAHLVYLPVTLSQR